MIHLITPAPLAHQPSITALRDALALCEEEGEVRWGFSPCDKFTALERWHEAGVLCPTFTQVREEAERWVREGHTVWGRRRTHARGRDIVALRPSRTTGRPLLRGHTVYKRWAGSDFWVQCLTACREWRVHIWDGTAFRTGLKHKTGAQRDERAGVVVRASRLGWELNYSQQVLDTALSKKQRKPLYELAKRACEILQVRGGAVDVLESEDGKFYALEVNTAPALGEFTLGAWVEALRASTAKPNEYVPAELEEFGGVGEYGE